MSDPVVSIVLPTHNGARFLRQAVESCLAQTFRQWELILVDDASTDETPRLIRESAAADPRIRSVRHETNRKLPGALNSGFALAQGKYLTWTSDDNAYRPHALARMVEFLDARPDVAVVYADYAVIDEQGDVTSLRVVGPTERLVFGNAVGACFLYRRVVHETIGGYAEDLFLSEDYDFWLRVSGRFRLERLDEDLYLYRRHPGSLTATAKDRIALAGERCFERNLPNLNWAGKRPLQRQFLRLAREAKQRGDLATCRKWLDRAVRIAPATLMLSAGRLLSILMPSTVSSRQRALGMMEERI